MKTVFRKAKEVLIKDGKVSVNELINTIEFLNRLLEENKSDTRMHCSFVDGGYNFGIGVVIKK